MADRHIRPMQLERRRAGASGPAIGSTGGPLLDRIQRRLGPAPRDCGSSALPRVLTLCLGVACVALDVVWVRTEAQTQNAPAAQFEVASIRPNREVTGLIGGSCAGSDSKPASGAIAALAKAAMPDAISPNRCRFTRVTLKMLIAEAYEIPPAEMERVITGGPRWIGDDRFDVDAKAETPRSQAELRLMLQSMLADRFKLRLHRETRDIQGYALSIAAGEPKLQPATGREPRSGMTTIGGGPLAASNTSMAMLASVLARRLGRPVEDRTGLSGFYNFTLSWTPGDEEVSPFGANLPPEIRARLEANRDASGTSLFTALREQLGLRLVSQKMAGLLFIVDSAEPPSPN